MQDNIPRIIRKYSIYEIDEMRENTRRLMITHYYCSDCRVSSGGYWCSNIPKQHEVEERLRTYLMAGIGPEEIKNRANVHEKEMFSRKND